MERGKGEQEIAEGSQEIAEGAEAGPDESGAFDGKSEGDGIVFQLNGDGERETGDSNAGVEETRGGGVFGAGVGGNEQRNGFVDDGQGEEKECERPAIVGPEQRVKDRYVGEGIGKDEEDIDGTKGPAEQGTRRGNNGVKKEEKRGEEQGAADESKSNVELVVPLPEIEVGADEGQGKKGPPVFVPTDEEGGGPEQQEIAEEDDLLVLAAAH